MIFTKYVHYFHLQKVVNGKKLPIHIGITQYNWQYRFSTDDGLVAWLFFPGLGVGPSCSWRVARRVITYHCPPALLLGLEMVTATKKRVGAGHGGYSVPSRVIQLWHQCIYFDTHSIYSEKRHSFYSSTFLRKGLLRTEIEERQPTKKLSNFFFAIS